MRNSALLLYFTHRDLIVRSAFVPADLWEPAGDPQKHARIVRPDGTYLLVRWDAGHVVCMN